METLIGPCRDRQEITRSRFDTYAVPVADAAAALAFFAEQFDGAATHNCWAYRVGQAYRFNDDGEPGGSAGKPILQAIDTLRLDRVAVLVVRWFGGIKLGTGGLARAYSLCAANCLRLGGRVLIVDYARARLAATFSELEAVKQLIEQYGCRIAHVDFQEWGATLTVDYPSTDAVALRQAYANITRGGRGWAA